MVQKYKKTGNISLFDFQNTQERLSLIGNPLEKISKVIDFEQFRSKLESKLLNKNKKNNAGAKPFDVVLMFKILILQRYYGLGDTQIEYQILDRMSFKQFLGLESGDKVPDEKTIWAFREALTSSNLIIEIFEQFNSFLESKGYLVNEGKMIDASFTVAPKQRNSKEENQVIKNGEGKTLWNNKPNKKRQKDVDARWTKKNNVTFFGYKNHAKVGTKSKLIETYVVTDASVHDSQPLDTLLSNKDKEKELYADSAYTGEGPENIIEKYEMLNQVHEKGYRNKPLTEEQKENNTIKSKTRARVEHVFGFMEQSMNGLIVRVIGKKRVESMIGLINLTYNLCRYEQIVRLNIEI